MACRRAAGAARVTAGTVYLVGAGPGDPGLMTSARVELIAAADVILYDRLIPPGALDGARDDAELVYVGKQGGGPQMPQEEIDRLLVEHGARGTRRAAEGRRPVRVRARRRGGARRCARPGSRSRSCRASPPASPRPPTRASPSRTATSRAASRSSPATRTRPSRSRALDWAALARFPGTLVFYMGVRALPRIAERLQAGRRPADEPVAVVERGTLPASAPCSRRSPTSPSARRPEGIRAPAITLVGPVAALRDDLAWLERRPLHGRTVAVTRARPGERARRAAARARRRGDRGAGDPDRAARRRAPGPGRLRPAVCVTSPTARTSCSSGSATRARWPAHGRRDRPRHGARSGEHGIAADIVPERSVAEGLVEALAGVARARALIAARARAATSCPTRCASAAPRSTSSRSTRRSPSRSTTTRPRPPPPPTTSRSPRLRRCATWPPRATLPGRRAGLDRARRRAPRCASTAREPDLEADPHTPDGLVDAALRPTRRDALIRHEAARGRDHLPHSGLRARRRVRRRRAAGVIAHECPTAARHRPATHGVPRQPGRAAGAIDAGARAPYTPPGVHLAVVDPRSARRGGALALRLRSTTGDLARRPPTTAPASPPPSASAWWSRRSRSRPRRGGSEPTSRRPSTAATCSRPSPPAGDVGEPLADAGTPLDPDDARAARAAAAAARQRRPRHRPRDGDRRLRQRPLDARPRRPRGQPASATRCPPANGRSARYLRTFADAEPGRAADYEDAAGMLALAVNGGEWRPCEPGEDAPGDEVRRVRPRERRSAARGCTTARSTRHKRRARELAAAGAPHGTLVTAGEQTAGRGRQGRRWERRRAPRCCARWCCASLRRRCCRLRAAPPSPTSRGRPRREVAQRRARGRRKVAGVLVEGRPHEGGSARDRRQRVVYAAPRRPNAGRSAATTSRRCWRSCWPALEHAAPAEPEAGRARRAARPRRAARRRGRWRAARACADGTDADGGLRVRSDAGRAGLLSAGEVPPPHALWPLRRRRASACHGARTWLRRARSSAVGTPSCLARPAASRRGDGAPRPAASSAAAGIGDLGLRCPRFGRAPRRPPASASAAARLRPCCRRRLRGARLGGSSAGERPRTAARGRPLGVGRLGRAAHRFARRPLGGSSSASASASARGAWRPRLRDPDRHRAWPRRRRAGFGCSAPSSPATVLRSTVPDRRLDPGLACDCRRPPCPSCLRRRPRRPLPFGKLRSSSRASAAGLRDIRVRAPLTTSPDSAVWQRRRQQRRGQARSCWRAACTSRRALRAWAPPRRVHEQAEQALGLRPALDGVLLVDLARHVRAAPDPVVGLVAAADLLLGQRLQHDLHALALLVARPARRSSRSRGRTPRRRATRRSPAARGCAAAGSCCARPP